jgi:hypothetical protein
MNKVNTNNLTWEQWSSPKGKFAGAGREVSEALGRKPFSTDLNERHPFDVEILPDSKKWLVRLPERRILRSEGLDYYEGEE